MFEAKGLFSRCRRAEGAFCFWGETVEEVATTALPATKALATTSVQPRFQPGGRDELVNRVYMGIIAFAQAADEAPRRGDQRRDVYLRDLVRSGVEPILTGAISSMVSRFVAMGWTVTGGRNKAARARSLLANAEDAKGWHTFLSKLVEDMLVTDKGGFFELGTLGKHGPVRGLFNLDATACALTGNPGYPVMYTPKVGRRNKQRPLDRDHVVHLPPMPSPDEAEFNLSLSAVSRALRAAQILKAINDHDTEKLQKLPPEGIMTVANITETQWKDVLGNYREARKKENMSVFPGLMVIAGQSITQPPKIDLVPFSTLPDGFDKKTTVEIYVKTLALALGVDVAELWLIPQVGATKAAFTIQHMKAQGKGIGLIVSMVERALNFHVMPQGIVFGFDLPDDEQDLAKAEIEGKRILNVKRMYETQHISGEGLVTRQEGRQILASQGILSPAFAESEEVTLFDVAKERTKGLGPFSWNGDEEIVTFDRQGHIVGLVLPTNWEEKAKQLAEEPRQSLSTDEALETLIAQKQDQMGNFRAAEEQYKLDLVALWRKESERVVRAMERLRKGRKKSLLARIVKQEDEDDLTEEEAAALLLLLRQAIEELSAQGKQSLTTAYSEALGVGEADLDAAQLAELEAMIESNEEFLFGSLLPDVEEKATAFGLLALAEKLATFNHRVSLYSSAFFGAIVAGLAFGKKADAMFYWDGHQDSGTCEFCSPLIGKTMKWEDRPFGPGDGSSPGCNGGCRCFPIFLD